MAQVKLILREDVIGLGEAGDVVVVKPGYARNFLVPQGKASLANAGNLKELEHHKRQIAEQVAKQLKDLKTTKSAMEKLKLEVTARAGEGGKLFGSVTAAQIAGLLAGQGYELDRRKIQLGEPIKETGDHVIDVRLHSEVIAKVKLAVVPEATVAAPEEDEPSADREADPEETRSDDA